MAAALRGVLVKLHILPGEPEEDHFPEPLGPEAMIVTFREPPCLALYGYLALAAAVAAVWFARRACQKSFLAFQGREHSHGPTYTHGQRRPFGSTLLQPLLRRRRQEGVHSLAFHQVLTTEDGSELTFTGFVDCGMGSLVFLLVPLTSALLFVIFGVIIRDYYAGCVWEWPHQLCYVGNYPIFGSFDTNSRLFLLLWTSSIAWFFLLISGRGGAMTNLFRLHAPLANADYVHITIQEKGEVVSSGHSRILAAWARAQAFVARWLGRSDVLGGMFGLTGLPSQTVAMCYDESLGIAYVEFRCVRYVLNRGHGRFSKYNAAEALQGGHDAQLDTLSKGGLSSQPGPSGKPTVDDMFRRIGPNKIPFEVDTWGVAITDEFATYFFLYQFAIYAVCIWFSYWHYTVLAMIVAVASGMLNVRVRLDNQRSVKAMIDQSSVVTLLRNGVEVVVDASDIVPGDIVKVQGEGWSVPCDLLLLKGAAVCDESTLTGESMPVQRLSPLEPLKEKPPQRFPAKHVLVGGTSVLQTSGEDCWAVATHTGVATQKGQLLLLILYPPKLIFKYDEQLSIVFGILLVYAIFVMIATMRMMYVRYAWDQNLPFTSLWAIAVFTCSCVLPTMLHIVLSVGQLAASSRLNAWGVFSVAPKRIALAGKVRVACFDKTGTLTESSLKFFGVHCLSMPPPAASASLGPFTSSASPTKGPVEFEADIRMQDWNIDILCAMACTHSLSPFSGSAEGVVGNAVEVNMFKATGWQLESQGVVKSPASSPEKQQRANILKRFDFSHTTMTMSAIVEHQPSGQKGIYCKGSFEHVVKLCKPETVPADFMAKAQAHALDGMYVLAFAARALPAGAAPPASRSETEKDLVLLGLLLFKNPLRSDTKDTIERLRGGEVRSVMITGDTSGTAICIAKEASLAVSGVPVLLGDLAEGKAGVRWIPQKDDLDNLSELLLSNDWLTWRRNYKLWREGGGQGARGEATVRARGAAAALPEEVQRTQSMKPPRRGEEERSEEKKITEEDLEFTTEELVLSRLFEWCELAVTQRAFDSLRSTTCSPDLRRILRGSRKATAKKGKGLSPGKGDSSLAAELLTSIRIFARMTPTGKINVVEGLMAQGIMTAMVGDGGNDSGALRTAHVGMALSSATSATVVAPFTTNRGSVAPIVDLLREGRAALATSFAGYKYNVHYGLLSSSLRFVTHYYGNGQPMMAKYLQDLLAFLGFSYVMTLSLPARELVSDRPTSSLFSVYVIGSVVGLWLINFACVLLAMWVITQHEDYVAFPVRKVLVTQWWKLSRNWETNAIFFIYSAQLFWSAAVFSFGYMYRQSWYRNIGLCIMVCAGIAMLLGLLLSPPNSFTRAFQLVYELVDDHEPWTPEEPCYAMPMEVRYQLLALLLSNMVCTALWEKAVVNGPLGAFIRDRCRALSKHVTLRL